MRKLTALFIMLLFGIHIMYAQQSDIKGTVTDKRLNEPIIGASVLVEGTSNGTITDMDGNFSLKNISKGNVLVVSYIGYQPQCLTIDGNQTTFRIMLTEDTQTLDEVVVVGFGTQKKVNLTGAVATVDTKTLESRPVTSVTQALQGVMPGLNIDVNDKGGRLDENPNMNIRGTGNLGTGSSASPLVLIDGAEGDINSLNPQDIANISVLKDAASSSIYGSRAPFGVILITTKSGEAGKTNIQYSGNFRWSRPTNIPDMLDSYRFAKYFNVAKKNEEGNEEAFIFSSATIDRIQKYMAGEYPYTSDPEGNQGGFFPFNGASNDNQNWPRNFIDKTSFGQEHNLSISGGSEKVKYYISGAFLSQEGQMNYSDEKKKRFNISGKVSGQVTKWLNLDFNARFIREDIGMPTFIKLYGDRFFAETTKLYPTMPLYDNNGHYTRNPKLMQLTSGGRSNSTKDTYFTQGGFHLTPIKGLGIHGQASLRTTNYQHQYNVNKVYLYNKENQPVEEAWLGGDNDLAAGKTFVQSETEQTSMMTTALYADYEYSWMKHNFKATAGMNSEYYRINNLVGKRYDVVNEQVPSINTATGTSVLKAFTREWATMGYFARLNYDYDGRYLIEGNIRRDATSRFRGDERWGTFPSVSVGWNIAREAFWEPAQEYVNLLKLRFSYGSLGNQNTESFYPTYSIQNITVGSADDGGRWLLEQANRSSIASTPGLVSSLLTWERVISYNAGLDFAAFNNRLTGYAEYYIRDTKDMVGPAEEISPIVGASAPKLNNTSLRTKGWELQVNWQDRIGQVGYRISLNLSDAQTEVTEYPNPDKTFYTKNSDGETIENYWKGKKLGEIWGFKTVGMAKTDQEIQDYIAIHDQSRLPSVGNNIWKAGDIMYANLDDNPAIEKGTSANDPKDLCIIGNSTPRYRFGITLGADYKGFDISMMFQGVAKRDIWVGGDDRTDYSKGMIFWGVNGGQWDSTGYDEHYDFFRPEGDELGANLNAYFPRPIIGSKQNQQVQTRYLQNAAYIRLKNLQVGYTLPTELIRKISLQKVRVFFSGDNLWTGSKMSKNFDPELLFQNGMSYPLSYTLSFGINITL
ncbi:SusC/RagA family TonB-linked outer membrane protein [Bacteroides congonensis]|uniref:SusC/RagA family TonB-linked outer membrane protein n=1 Tax=Bacteroides congonensis TaxID=1871006 RepID=UPI00189DF218|nr:TonB-dependent receptor [Bacteroides congonensis]